MRLIAYTPSIVILREAKNLGGINTFPLRSFVVPPQDDNVERNT